MDGQDFPRPNIQDLLFVLESGTEHFTLSTQLRNHHFFMARTAAGHCYQLEIQGEGLGSSIYESIPLSLPHGVPHFSTFPMGCVETFSCHIFLSGGCP